MDRKERLIQHLTENTRRWVGGSEGSVVQFTVVQHKDGRRGVFYYDGEGNGYRSRNRPRLTPTCKKFTEAVILADAFRPEEPL